MYQIFEDLEGVETDIDDILVWGKTRQEHDDRLRATLHRAKEQNPRFNAAKCKVAPPVLNIDATIRKNRWLHTKYHNIHGRS